MQLLTLVALVVLKGLEGSEGGTASNELVAPAAVVRLLVAVDLVVGVAVFTWAVC